jgi:site-specific DNA recombinase
MREGIETLRHMTVGQLKQKYGEVFGEQLAAGEARAEELRKEILRREKQRIDEKELRRAMDSFEEVWKTMSLEEQRNLLRQLVEKVGYDGRTGKVTVSFKSAEVKELVQKEAVR